MTDSGGASYALLNRDPQLNSELACYALGLLHDAIGKHSGFGTLADFEQGCPGQCANWIERQISHQLDPDFLPDVGPDGAPDSGASKSLRNGAAALAL